MAKIIITGGTGLVGKRLSKLLIDKNHEVVILSRNPKNENEFKWDISSNYVDEKALVNSDYIIHLAGAGIADKRWTEERKQIIIDSRVKTANLLFDKITELKIELKGFISASGIGYYGAITSDKIFKENDAPENDFISKVCVEWEKSVHQFKELNIQVTILRTGVVLSKTGGALQKMNTPLFLSALGNGKQFLPWIHIDDLCNLYVKSIENSYFKGVFNAVAPEHQTNKNFNKTLSKIIQKPVLLFKIPSFILNIFLVKWLTC